MTADLRTAAAEALHPNVEATRAGQRAERLPAAERVDGALGRRRNQNTQRASIRAGSLAPIGRDHVFANDLDPFREQ